MLRRDAPAEWMDIHSWAAEGLAKSLPPLLKTIKDGPLTGVLRSLHLLVLSRPQHMMDAIKGYGAGEQSGSGIQHGLLLLILQPLGACSAPICGVGSVFIVKERHSHFVAAVVFPQGIAKLNGDAYAYISQSIKLPNLVACTCSDGPPSPRNFALLSSYASQPSPCFVVSSQVCQG